MFDRISLDQATLTRVRLASTMIVALAWLVTIVQPGVLTTLLAMLSLGVPVIPFGMKATDQPSPEDAARSATSDTAVPVSPADSYETHDPEQVDPFGVEGEPDLSVFDDDLPEGGAVEVDGPASSSAGVDVDDVPLEAEGDGFDEQDEWHPIEDLLEWDVPEMGDLEDADTAIEVLVEPGDVDLVDEDHGPVDSIEDTPEVELPATSVSDPVEEVPFPDPIAEELEAEDAASSDEVTPEEATVEMPAADYSSNQVPEDEHLGDEPIELESDEDVTDEDHVVPELADREIGNLTDLEEVLGLEYWVVESLVTAYGDGVMDALAIDPRRTLSEAGLAGADLKAAVDRYTEHRSGLPFAVASFGEIHGEEARPVADRRRGEEFVCVVELQLKDGPPFLLAGFGKSSNLAFQKTMDGLVDYMATGYSIKALRLGDNAGAVEAVYMKAVAERREATFA